MLPPRLLSYPTGSSHATSTLPYPSDLTHDQWRRLQPWLPAPKTRGRPRSVALREVVDAMRYVLRTGCAWRSLPHDFPCWQTVYGYFRTWCRVGSGSVSTRLCGPKCVAARVGR